jgi:Uma2 family endonuclease
MAVDTIAAPTPENTLITSPEAGGQRQCVHAAGESYRFSVDDYYRMAELGIFPPDARVELIKGAILTMSPVGGKRVTCVSSLMRRIDRQLDDTAIVNVQAPVHLDDDSQPEPDVAVVRVRAYGREVPRPADVFLLVEVSDTTLAFDRDTKIPLYAASGIPEVWLVDLNAETVTRYTKPNAGAYDLQERFRRGDTLTIGALPSVTVAVDDVLPSDATEPTAQAEQPDPAAQEDPAGG